MKKEQIQEIIQCLPDDRTLFHYHEDRYALWLLASHVGKGYIIEQDDLRSFSHPVLDKGKRRFNHETLAWSRMDIDLARGEALIEEIQNDWLRFAKRWQRCASKQFSCTNCRIKSQKDQVSFYLEHILKPYYKIWSEAMLAATLWFLYRELGINKIFYHNYETGCQLKKITGRKPPRSIYTDLPRQFCFTKTTLAPQFLLQDKRFTKRMRKMQIKSVEWQTLQLENSHAWA